jgi:bifunctional pyridoxal-dependent enzyme with beta-cystathionase and maltose regulon repressor activities
MVSTTMRLRQALRRHLEAAAARAERSVSNVALIGDENLDRVRRAFSQFSSAQITAALIHYKRYLDEIRRELEENAALTAEMLQERYPGLVRVVAVG